MLIIAKRGQENVVREIFEKWDVPCAEIGRVTDDGMMRVRNNGSIAAEIPAKPLAEEAPLYSRDVKPPSSVAAVYDRRINELPKIDNHQALRQLLAIQRLRRRTGSIANTITPCAPAQW